MNVQLAPDDASYRHVAASLETERIRPNILCMARSSVRQYEYRIMTFGRETSRRESLQLLTEHAEYGHWELARTILGMGGRRTVWLRRKIIRMQPTL
ncbi:DUF5703 family protein [Spelaeicoccus albus]|uniref:Uncharacterized protein n=2 Tax=Spelaeicoccus albus TaxID=1280376 RepID=A0A7Z0D3Y2_9MICO|nr:hypothetical protein [Spelaeicoccus albus]